MHFFDRLDPDEVASAMFMCGDVMERVNLLKINHADELLLRGTGESVLPEEPKALPYPYGDYVASVFGKYFRLPDESFFTYMDGWLISGSARAVNEYVSGWALDYPLKMYMADAGAGDFFAAGFLYGLSMGQSLERCAQIGTLLAGEVIQVVGTELEAATWEKLKKEITQNA
jgi:hypothetical protein